MLDVALWSAVDAALVSAGFCTSLAAVSVLADAEGAAADSVLVEGVAEEEAAGSVLVAAGADWVLELVAFEADALASGVVLVAGAAVSVLVEGVLCAVVVLAEDCADVSVEAEVLAFGCIVISLLVVAAGWLLVLLAAPAISASFALPVGAGDAALSVVLGVVEAAEAD